MDVMNTADCRFKGVGIMVSDRISFNVTYTYLYKPWMKLQSLLINNVYKRFHCMFTIQNYYCTISSGFKGELREGPLPSIDLTPRLKIVRRGQEVFFFQL